MRTSRAIGQLIDACIDDKRMLEHERHVVHGHRRDVLERLTDERTRVVERLKGLGHLDSRPHAGSFIEMGREVGRTLRGLLAPSTEGDAISACRRSCRRTEERFDKALELSWPDKTRAVLVEERARLHSASNALIAIQF